MDTMTTMKKWEDEYFTLTKKVEEPVVRYTGRMADTVAEYVPARPGFLAQLPTMHEVVDNGLKFRKRMVDEQAIFVRKLLKAMEPVTTKMETPAPIVEPAVKAVKDQVRKVTPRRTVKAA